MFYVFYVFFENLSILVLLMAFKIKVLSFIQQKCFIRLIIVFFCALRFIKNPFNIFTILFCKFHWKRGSLLVGPLNV